MDKPTTLYRFFGPDDELLYIGITEHGAMRFAAHRTTKHWWPEVATITVEHYETRRDALRAEAVAIRKERPIHNVDHNGVRPVKPWAPGELQRARLIAGALR